MMVMLVMMVMMVMVMIMMVMMIVMMMMMMVIRLREVMISGVLGRCGSTADRGAAVCKNCIFSFAPRL